VEWLDAPEHTCHLELIRDYLLGLARFVWLVNVVVQIDESNVTRARPQLIYAHVGRDPREPRAHLVLAVETTERLEAPKERFLRGFLDVHGVPEEPLTDVANARHVPTEEFVVGVFFT
jgi:hypothetical protein